MKVVIIKNIEEPMKMRGGRKGSAAYRTTYIVY